MTVVVISEQNTIEWLLEKMFCTEEIVVVIEV